METTYILVITLYCFSYSAETNDENTPFIIHHIRRKNTMHGSAEKNDKFKRSQQHIV